MLRVILILTTCILLSNCEKEPPWRPIEELEFTCVPSTAEVYFEGTFNDKPFCYYDGSDGYVMVLWLTSKFITSGPTVSINPDSNEVPNASSWVSMGIMPTNGYRHGITIQTPIYQAGTELMEVIKNEITSVEPLPLRHYESSTPGFNIQFAYADREKGGQEWFDTASGPKDNGYLEITDLRIVESPTPGASLYEVTFEFECDLYYYYEPGLYYATLRDCVMKLMFYV